MVSCSKDGASTDASAVSADSPLGRIDAYIAEQERTGRINRAGNQWWRINLPPPPPVEFPAGTKVFWELKTNKGDIGIELFPEAAPKHVASFAYLTRLGFYDGTIIHRISPGFVIQGGCPRGNGSGSPGYSLDGEFGPGLSHDAKGVVSMANSGPGTDGSQFFITLRPAKELDGGYSIVGKVLDGWATVETIARFGTPSERPSEQLIIHEAKIRTE
jgi:cyclophilin family peptidyl-prolyl cis-trans isomerase